MITKQDIIHSACAFVNSSEGNRLNASTALLPELAGLRFFEEPIFAFGAAGDYHFELLQQPQAIGPMFQPPGYWLDGAKSVVSYFLPFTEAVRSGNLVSPDDPSPVWLHARMEGQAFNETLCRHLMTYISESGYECAAPSLDSRFTAKSQDGHTQSAWSERHIAYVCGLGTFSLSAGIITERGMAGRLGSIVTTATFPPDDRPYSDIYEYCTRCNVCIGRCPAGAITAEGMDRKKCATFLDTTREKHAPRYGCGKCQVGVPCESRRP